MLTITLGKPEPRCPCGARRDASSKRCRKCRARSRWMHRKAWRTNKSPDQLSRSRKR
jgi:hypothetical protein